VRPTAADQHASIPLRRAVAARTAVGACAISAGAHAGLVPEHLREAPQLGVAFAVAAGMLVAAATALAIRPGSLRAARGAALLLAGLIGFYAASRITGIPLLEPRAEPLDAVGATTKLVEALGLVFALRLSRSVGDRRSPLTQEVAR
jgi:hypothetical protein